jgi:adenylate cyclase
MMGLLIVDDEEGIRRSIQAALRHERYEIALAEDGQKAVDLVKADPAAIAIVISDFKMPGMDGLEALAAIGNLNPEICRIMLTGYATLESAIQATNEGIDGFLTKPFDNNELRFKVREYFINKSLKRLLSPQILKQIHQEPGQIVPRRQKVSVLFTDIRGFTPLCERTDPEQLVTLLTDNYFNPLSEIAFRHNGTLDEYCGDGIMLFYGAPISYGDDERRAVMSALDMRERMDGINEKLLARGLPQLPLGVSIATGEYTVFGLTVNIAARLEKLAGAGQIIIDEATYRAVHDCVRVEKLQPVSVKGVTAPVQVYQVIGMR